MCLFLKVNMVWNDKVIFLEETPITFISFLSQRLRRPCLPVSFIAYTILLTLLIYYAYTILLKIN